MTQLMEMRSTKLNNAITKMFSNVLSLFLKETGDSRTQTEH